MRGLLGSILLVFSSFAAAADILELNPPDKTTLSGDVLVMAVKLGAAEFEKISIFFDGQTLCSDKDSLVICLLHTNKYSPGLHILSALGETKDGKFAYAVSRVKISNPNYSNPSSLKPANIHTF